MRLLILIPLLVFLFFSFYFVSAETENLLITWRANNYVPTGFVGKAPSINGNVVGVSVELLLNKKIQNISQATISWFVDGVFFNKGVGMKEFSFVVTKVGRSSHSVGVIIQTKANKYEGLVSIPVFNPVVTIENKYSKGIVSSGEQLNLLVVPYFFNISSPSEITSLWSINNEKQKGARDAVLTLNIGSPKTQEQKNMVVESFVQNIRNKIEFAKDKINFFIQ